jgi:hypothetical protein
MNRLGVEGCKRFSIFLLRHAHALLKTSSLFHRALAFAAIRGSGIGGLKIFQPPMQWIHGWGVDRSLSERGKSKKVRGFRKKSLPYGG